MYHIWCIFKQDNYKSDGGRICVYTYNECSVEYAVLER